MNRLGAYLRDLRTARGLTVRDLGRAVGCSPNLIRMVENGYRRPSIRALWRLIEVLAADMAEALTLLAADSGVPANALRRGHAQPETDEVRTT